MGGGRYDVAIVGAGVVGCSVARELARYRLKVVVLEKESDVAEGASGANSGVLHSGFKEPKMSKKALYCVEGNRRFREEIAEELEVPFKPIGTYTVGETEKDREKLEKLLEAGTAAGAEGLRIIEEDELKKAEPHVRGKVALLAPTGAIIDPHEYVIALAENAAVNGVDFDFNTEVADVEEREGGYVVKTACGDYHAKYVVNSAGVYADKLAAMVGYNKHKVNPCRGEYFILDKKVGGLIRGMIYPMPPEKTGGIGVHLTPTIAGNILIGPSAEYIACKDDVASTAGRMKELYEGAVALVPEIEYKDIIHEYSGLRSKIIEPGSANKGDFVVEDEPEGFIQLLGIESPGLTAAPVLAEKVREIIQGHEKLEENPDFNPRRKARARFSELSKEEKRKLIREDPDYGVIVCRCEEVTKREIRDALENPLGVRTLKGLRIRTRAGMGRCQGGFCLPRILQIIDEIYGQGVEATLKGAESRICDVRMR
ncbi:MAG: FAD-dependent oxidoreductase [Candidatus Altiarchaeales archaeon]|nr:FAD-dependent oxidoreductase [Candidatus Altiarchaeales archaeon]MBD3416818.1 FAD-dependent oxidoreductase [Candidatus Altiarchaeales archaeon]